MRAALLFLPMILLAGCGPVAPVAPTPQQQQRLAAELDGRVAGAPMRCLPSFRAQDMRVIGSDILFRDGATIYRARTNGGCEAAQGSGYVMVFDYRGDTELCSGMIAKVVSSSSRMFAGSCAIEDITPYRRP